MALVEVDARDVALLKSIAEVMRQGRAAELIHEQWPRGAEDLAAKFAYAIVLDRADSGLNASFETRRQRAQRNHEVHS